MAIFCIANAIILSMIVNFTLIEFKNWRRDSSFNWMSRKTSFHSSFYLTIKGFQARGDLEMTLKVVEKAKIQILIPQVIVTEVAEVPLRTIMKTLREEP